MREDYDSKHFLDTPACKSGHLVIVTTLSRVIKFVKYFIHKHIEKVLRNFSQRRMGSDVIPDKLALTTFDTDVISYQDDFKKKAEVISLCTHASCCLKDLWPNLVRDVGTYALYSEELVIATGDGVVRGFTYH